MRRIVLVSFPLLLLLLAGEALAQPHGTCVEDAYEPDSFASPQALNPGRMENLAVCHGNDDYWQVNVEPGMHVTLRIEFNHAMGDVDMTLHHAGNPETIGVSESMADYEELTYTATSSETLVLNVYGYAGASNGYALALFVDDYSVACAGDAFEPNSFQGQAQVPPDGINQARICMGDEDWYAIDLLPGEGFDFGIDYDLDMSALSMGLYTPENPYSPSQVITPSGDSGMVMLQRSETGGRYHVRVFSSGDGFNHYSFSVAKYVPGVEETGTVVGQIQYEDELRGADIIIGAESVRWLPSREIPVELVRQLDDRTIATGYTDEAGNFTIPFVHRAGGEVFVRVSPRLEGPGYELQIVHDEIDWLLQQFDTAPLSTVSADVDGHIRVDLAFTLLDDLGGAFNIADRCLDAFRFVAETAQPDDLDLTIAWERGRPHDCTSCYADSVIYLGGGFDDPDEYDDSVILHEFGHFFIDIMSHDDSPGGDHDGARTDPLVAYGEGIATFFAMAVQGNAIYADTMLAGGMLQDFERAPFSEARGTQNGTLSGLVSEYLVAALIWDLYDGVGEAHDNIEVGAGPVFQVLYEHLPNIGASNQGVPGVDMADFVYGFRILFPEYTDELDRILAHYQFPGGTLVQTGPVGGAK